MKPNIKSKSEHFYRNMFFDSLVRLRSVLLPYCIFLMVLGPVMTFLIIANDRSTNSWRIQNDWKLDIDSYILFGIFLVAVLFCILVTLVLTRYLHQKNEADVFLALPIKRTNTVFLRMTAGGLFLFLPLLLSFIATEIVLYMNRDWVHINIDIHVKLFGLFVFFLIITYLLFFLSAIIANTAADTIIFSVILQLVLPAIGYLTFLLIRSGNIGFPSSLKWIENVLYLSPALSFYQYGLYLSELEYVKHTQYYDEIVYAQYGSDFYVDRNFNIEQMNLLPILCWSILIFILLFLIRILAEKRKAEDTSRKDLSGILPTMFLCIFIYAGAGITTLAITDRVKQINFFSVSGFAFLGGAVLGFTIYGLLNKGYNNMLEKSWKQYFFSIFASVTIINIIYFAPLLDYTPPEINDIEYISIRGLSVSYQHYPFMVDLNEALFGEYEPMVSIENEIDMGKIISGHQNLINNDCFINDAFMNNSLEITYHFKKGTNRKLAFITDWSPETSKILREMRGEEYIRESNAVFAIQPEQIDNIEIYAQANENDYSSSSFISKEHNIEELLEALRMDILDLDSKVYEDIFVFNSGEIYEKKEEEFCGHIFIHIKIKNHKDVDYFIVSGVPISIHTEYTRTIAWLRGNGYAEYLEKFPGE